MKLLFSYALFCIAMGISAQSIPKDIIASGGDMIEGSTGKLNFTVGEPIVGLVSNSESINQGFWAGSGILVIPLTVGENSVEIAVYPNPVVEELTILAGDDRVMHIQLFAVNAQRVLNQKVDASLLEHKVDLSYLTRGVYILQLLLEEGNELQEYKIIKN